MSCKYCGLNFPEVEFYSYMPFTCKKCNSARAIQWSKNNPEKVIASRRKTRLKYKYNLSLEDYNKLVEAQNNKCALCLKEHTRRPLNVDHCHKTGKVRGLLCDKCNLGIGLFDDNPILLQKVKDYLNQ